MGVNLMNAMYLLSKENLEEIATCIALNGLDATEANQYILEVAEEMQDGSDIDALPFLEDHE